MGFSRAIHPLHGSAALLARVGVLGATVCLSGCGSADAAAPNPLPTGSDTGPGTRLDVSPPQPSLSDGWLHEADAGAAEDVVPQPEASSEDAQQDSAATSDSPEDHDAPGSLVCGDGYRNVATEGCDDGLGVLSMGNARACDQNCQVVERVVVGPTGNPVRTGGMGNDGVLERWLGSGRHPAAGNSAGSAVVWTQLLDGDAGDGTRVGIATFAPNGLRRGLLELDDAPFDANPVVAALSDGTFAVAFNSLAVDGDGLGIALAQVDADGSLIGTVQAANETGWLGQHSPDIVWSGTKLVVSWEDESAIPRRLCRRSFSSTLAPLGSELCEEHADGWASRLTLEPFDGDTARSWREDRAGDGGPSYAVVVVASGSNTWTSASLGLPAADETAALVAIDATHLLVITGDQHGVLSASVLDDGLSLVDQLELCTSATPRFKPSVVVSDDGIYLSWMTPAAPPDPDAGWDPRYEDVWLQRLGWDGDELDASALPITLPSGTTEQLGAQRRPALAAVPYYPSGAVVAVWEDLTVDNYVDQCPHGDVIVSLIPTPVLR